MSALGDDVVRRFREVLGELTGLAFDDDKLTWLRGLLQSRLEATAQGDDIYIDSLSRQGAAAHRELQALAPELTVAETYFFRNNQQFSACRDAVVPERLRAHPDQKRLRVLSAGCATGEEPYSLAILMREAGCEASILGVDINPVVLEKAKHAHYASWALRETSEERQSRWFRPSGRLFALDESIRGAVQFERRNLNLDDPELLAAGTYDIIFCRNMLMYFAKETSAVLVARLARALQPGGYLFLGHAETLRGVTDAFQLCHTHGTFFYQSASMRSMASGAGSSVLPALEVQVAPHVSTDWYEAIAAASTRIRELTDGPNCLPPRPEPEGSDSTLAELLRLLESERFTRARQLVAQLPRELAQDPDIALVEAVLLVHAGDFDAAESICRRLLTQPNRDAGVHYLLALTYESRGDVVRAMYQDSLAIGIEPSFGLAHLHLGLLSRRAGEFVRARRELLLAQSLLEHERLARIVLFGGGFGRSTLLDLCRTQLAGETGP